MEKVLLIFAHNFWFLWVFVFFFFKSLSLVQSSVFTLSLLAIYRNDIDSL